MEKINIIGTIFGQSGYDSHTRQLANALYELGKDVRLDVPKPQGWERLVTDAELNMLTKDYDNQCTTIMISTPPSWRLALADNPKKFIGFCVWEGDKIPKYWMEYMIDDRVDEIFVPSKHTKDAILKTMTDCSDLETKEWKGRMNDWDKIKIIPHGVDTSLFTPQDPNAPHSEDFTFLVNKGWRGGKNDRGGVQFALQAFAEEFTDKDKVCLKIKLNPAYVGPNFVFSEEVKKLNIKALTKKDKPKIMVNADNIDYKKLPKFYQGDVFVSPTMAEAFNIPVAEAMSCDIMPIVTGYSGHCDFVKDKKTGLYIDYKMMECKSDLQYEGISWAKPNIKHLRELMRWCYDNKDEVKKIGKDAGNYIRDNYSWRNSAKKIKTLIK